MSFHRLDSEVGQRVLARCNYKCVKCDSSSDLCVHHLVKVDVNDTRYNDESNLVVLCRRCHMSLHRQNGDIPNYTGPRTGRRGSYDEILCEVTGCFELQHGKGFCRKHYYKFVDKPTRIRRTSAGKETERKLCV